MSKPKNKEPRKPPGRKKKKPQGESIPRPTPSQIIEAAMRGVSYA